MVILGDLPFKMHFLGWQCDDPVVVGDATTMYYPVFCEDFFCCHPILFQDSVIQPSSVSLYDLYVFVTTVDFEYSWKVSILYHTNKNISSVGYRLVAYFMTPFGGEIPKIPREYIRYIIGYGSTSINQSQI